jgi:hypothetical protein
MKIEKITLIITTITSLGLLYYTYTLKQEVDDLSYDVYRLQTEVESIRSDIRYLK